MKYSHVYYRHVASISHPVLQYKQLKKALKKGPRHVEALLLADLDAIEDAIASNRMTDEELSWYSCVLYVACLKITKKIAKKLKDVGGPQIRSRALHHPAFSVLANLVLVHDRELTPSPSKLALVMCDECHEQHSSVVITDDGQTLCPPCLSALRRTDLGAKSSPCEPEALETPEAYESRRQSAIAIDRALEGTSERPTKYHIVDSERRDSLQVPPAARAKAGPVPYAHRTLHGPVPCQCHAMPYANSSSASGPGLLVPHLRREWAHQCHAWTGPTSARELAAGGEAAAGYDVQHLRRQHAVQPRLSAQRAVVPRIRKVRLHQDLCPHLRQDPPTSASSNAPGGRARPRQPNKTLPHPRQKL
jgi:hypothetical protein